MLNYSMPTIVLACQEALKSHDYIPITTPYRIYQGREFRVRGKQIQFRPNGKWLWLTLNQVYQLEANLINAGFLKAPFFDNA